jgi:hypothetical protein
MEQLPSLRRDCSKSSPTERLPLDMLASTGEFLKGFVAMGNDREPHPKTKSYRLVVTFNVEAKKEMKALIKILREDSPREIGFSS